MAMPMALSNNVNPVLCSSKLLHSAIDNNAQVSSSAALWSSWRGSRQCCPITLRHAVVSCRARVLRRHPHLRVQAAKQTFSSFDDMLQKSDQPVLVDFYATWCGPCQYMVPILEDVGHRLKDKIRVVKIDTEKYPNVASRYGVQALPTFILFRDGQPFDRLEGAIPANQLIERIEKLLQVSK